MNRTWPWGAKKRGVVPPLMAFMCSLAIGCVCFRKPSALDCEVRLKTAIEHFAESKGSREEAFRMLKAAAKADCPEAMNVLAAFYLEGIGTDPDVDQALGWHRRAAELGSAHGALSAGLLLEQRAGWGSDEGLLAGAEWYRKAAELGEPMGRHKVAIMYLEGVGVSKNTLKGLHWLELAAEGKDDEAMYHLALVIMEGELLAYDPRRAYDLFLESSVRGNARAATRLGLMLWAGFLGFEDKGESLALFWLAEERGDPEAVSMAELRHELLDTEAREHALEVQKQLEAAGELIHTDPDAARDLEAFQLPDPPPENDKDTDGVDFPSQIA